MALHAELDPDDVDSPPAIGAHGLVKSFGTLRAVDDVTFDLAPGRIYGVLGPNGSGKTTLIRLLTGLTVPTAGWAEVLGTRMPSRPNLGRIGYMTQTDGVYTALTVSENLRFFGAVYGVEETKVLGDGQGRVDAIGLGHVSDPAQVRAGRHPRAQHLRPARGRDGEP